VHGPGTCKRSFSSFFVLYFVVHRDISKKKNAESNVAIANCCVAHDMGAPANQQTLSVVLRVVLWRWGGVGAVIYVATPPACDCCYCAASLHVYTTVARRPRRDMVGFEIL
jgi:hypothetical protein